MVVDRSVESTVPWEFSGSDGFQQYLWDHSVEDKNLCFRATVSNQAGSWSWLFEAGPATGVLWRTSGRGASFEACQQGVLEVVGKGFTRTADLVPLVAEAASTYTLGGGVRVDLTDLDGHLVVVELLSAQHATATGRLVLAGWVLKLVTSGGSTYELNPFKVKSISLA